MDFFMFTPRPVFSKMAFQNANFWHSSSTDSPLIIRSSVYYNFRGNQFWTPVRVLKNCDKNEWTKGRALVHPKFYPETLTKAIFNMDFTSHFVTCCLNKVYYPPINSKLRKGGGLEVNLLAGQMKNLWEESAREDWGLEETLAQYNLKIIILMKRFVVRYWSWWSLLCCISHFDRRIGNLIKMI